MADVKVTGVAAFRRRIRRFDERTQRRLYRKVLNQSSAPIKTALRKAIRQARAVRFGHMLKAVTSKVKVYDQVTVLLVGVRDKRKADGENPGKYFHLVSGGTRPHFQPNAFRLFTVNGFQYGVRIGGQHPGSSPRQLREKAIREGGPKVAQRFADRASKAIAKEIGS